MNYVGDKADFWEDFARRLICDTLSQYLPHGNKSPVNFFSTAGGPSSTLDRRAARPSAVFQ